jgi:hypothetical protein
VLVQHVLHLVERPEARVGVREEAGDLVGVHRPARLRLGHRCVVARLVGGDEVGRDEDVAAQKSR